MKKHYLIVIGVLFLSSYTPIVCAEKKNDLIQTAKYFSNAFLKKDFKTLINMYEPSMVESMGGENMLIKKIEEGLLLSEQENMAISDIEILGESTVVSTSDSEEYALVYTKNTINSEKEKMFIDSYMVFVTRDGFPFWFFVAEGGYETGQILKGLLGEKYKDLNIPTRKFYNEDGSFVMIEKKGEWVPDKRTYESLKDLVEKSELGYKRYSTKGHSKAKGIELTLEYPETWKSSEGERPNIVQVFAKDIEGKISTSCYLMIKNIPSMMGYETEEELANEIFTAEGVQTLLGSTHKNEILQNIRTTYDGQPGVRTYFTRTASRAGIDMVSHELQHMFLYNKKMVVLSCASGGEKTKEGEIALKSTQYRPIFTRIGGSIVLNDKW